MFDNIGKKMKTLASLEITLGIVVSIIIGIIVMSEVLLLGIVVIIVGSWISWVSSIFMYGFGELIEKTSEIAHNTSKKGSAGTLTSKMENEQKLATLLQWKENGLISDEEYELKKQALLKEV